MKMTQEISKKNRVLVFRKRLLIFYFEKYHNNTIKKPLFYHRKTITKPLQNDGRFKNGI